MYSAIGNDDYRKKYIEQRAPSRPPRSPHLTRPKRRELLFGTASIVYDLQVSNNWLQIVPIIVFATRRKI